MPTTVAPIMLYHRPQMPTTRTPKCCIIGHKCQQLSRFIQSQNHQLSHFITTLWLNSYLLILIQWMRWGFKTFVSVIWCAHVEPYVTTGYSKRQRKENMHSSSVLRQKGYYFKYRDRPFCLQANEFCFKLPLLSYTSRMKATSMAVNIL